MNSTTTTTEEDVNKRPNQQSESIRFTLQRSQNAAPAAAPTGAAAPTYETSPFPRTPAARMGFANNPVNSTPFGPRTPAPAQRQRDDEKSEGDQLQKATTSNKNTASGGSGAEPLPTLTFPTLRARRNRPELSVSAPDQNPAAAATAAPDTQAAAPRKGKITEEELQQRTKEIAAQRRAQLQDVQEQKEGTEGPSNVSLTQPTEQMVAYVRPLWSHSMVWVQSNIRSIFRLAPANVAKVERENAAKAAAQSKPAKEKENTEERKEAEHKEPETLLQKLEAAENAAKATVAASAPELHDQQVRHGVSFTATLRRLKNGIRALNFLPDSWSRALMYAGTIAVLTTGGWVLIRIYSNHPGSPMYTEQQVQQDYAPPAGGTEGPLTGFLTQHSPGLGAGGIFGRMQDK